MEHQAATRYFLSRYPDNDLHLEEILAAGKLNF
jgi:hypothetical protein